MTTRAMAAPTARAAWAALLAGLAGLPTPHLIALAWSLLASAVWGVALRVVVFVDPAAVPPPGYLAASLLFTVALGGLLGAGLAWALTSRAGAARWGPWAAFATGVALSAAGVDAQTLWSPVVLLLIGSSALGFRLGARLGKDPSHGRRRPAHP